MGYGQPTARAMSSGGFVASAPHQCGVSTPGTKHFTMATLVVAMDVIQLLNLECCIQKHRFPLFMCKWCGVSTLFSLRSPDATCMGLVPPSQFTCVGLFRGGSSGVTYDFREMATPATVASLPPAWYSPQSPATLPVPADVPPY